jgi:hypothetical protein
MNIKDIINNKLLYKLSQIGYALNCDLMFTNRVPEINNTIEQLYTLENGASIFISLCETNINLYTLVDILKNKNIKVNFYLMQEPIVPRETIDLLDTVALNFFIQNNIYSEYNMHCMLIGIRDCEKVCPGHYGFSHDYLYNEGIKIVNKEYLCLLCFSYSHEERYICYNTLKDLPFVKDLNKNEYENQPSIHCGKVPVCINYEETHKSIYTLSPRGCGVDCHRFYEAIYLDSIPIVKKTNTAFDKVYDVFPCLVINNWEDITEERPNSNKDNLQKKILEFKTEYPNAFTCMETIHELLLKT